MDTHPFLAPLLLSAALHGAALSGALLAGAGMDSGVRNTPVVFVDLGTPGKSGASGSPGGPARARSPAPARHESLVVAGREETAAAPAEPATTAGDSMPAGYDVEGRGGGASPGNTDVGDAGAGRGPDGGDGAGGEGEGTSRPATIAALPEPAYPRYSRSHGEEGTVVLEAEITEAGKPARVRILHSSGYRRLDDAALNALKKAAFVPATARDVPVASTKRIAVRFEIQDRRERLR